MARDNSTPNPIPKTIVNTPLWRGMGARREEAVDLQNALVDHFGTCCSWREIITGAVEEAANAVCIPDGMDEETANILAFDTAAVAGFCLAVTAPKTTADVATWGARAGVLMDVANWEYRNWALTRPEPRRPHPWNLPGRLARWLRLWEVRHGS